MAASVDAAAMRVTDGTRWFPFELSCTRGIATFPAWDPPVTLRVMTWGERRALARFAGLGGAFLAEQMLGCCAVPRPPTDARDAALSLLVWLHTPNGETGAGAGTTGAGALPLDAHLLAMVTLRLCQALAVPPATLDAMPSPDVDLLWQALLADTGDGRRSAEDDGVTRIMVLPDAARAEAVMADASTTPPAASVPPAPDRPPAMPAHGVDRPQPVPAPDATMPRPRDAKAARAAMPADPRLQPSNAAMPAEPRFRLRLETAEPERSVPGSIAPATIPAASGDTAVMPALTAVPHAEHRTPIVTSQLGTSYRAASRGAADPLVSSGAMPRPPTPPRPALAVATIAPTDPARLLVEQALAEQALAEQALARVVAAVSRHAASATRDAVDPIDPSDRLADELAAAAADLGIVTAD